MHKIQTAINDILLQRIFTYRFTSYGRKYIQPVNTILRGLSVTDKRSYGRKAVYSSYKKNITVSLRVIQNA
jgi:hypothetical protein